MKTLPLSEGKDNPGKLVDHDEMIQEEITITHNDKPAAVTVSPEEYEVWNRTFALRSEAEFISEIRKGIKALKRKPQYYLKIADLPGQKS